MDDIESVVKFFESIEASDWSALQGMLAEDFRYHGPTPDPVDKQRWLDFQMAIQKAFPDWSYNIQKIEKIHDAIEVTVHITGTHQQVLNLPIEGFGPVQPTHKKIHMPIEHALLKVADGKIVELIVEKQLHGGLPGLLEQLGLE